MGVAHREYFYIGGACVVGAVGLFYAVKWIQRRIRNYRHPFEHVGVVSELYVYPVKSCRGRQVQWMQCGKRGGCSGEMQDRHFLIINAQTKHFVTARTHPRIVLIDSDVRDNVLTLTTPENTPVRVDLEKVIADKKAVTAILHGDLKQTGLDCGEQIGEWLSKVLEVEQPLQLLYYKDGLYTERSCQRRSRWFFGLAPTQDDEIAFVDLAPYMAFSNESLNELNSRYDENSEKIITTRHFRPSIVVDKCPAFDEDLWMELKIGDAEFDCYKPCARGVMTTVDPSTGEKDPDVEPLQMLREYRLAPEGKMRTIYKQSPIFGVNMGLNKEGTIRVGDEVYARYKDEPF
uniref:MOSC domain-containing protein 1 n=2 Tax=Ascaris TaxID=6251 RepID=F1L2W1_ASCSU